jgi:hypothetical protein
MTVLIIVVGLLGLATLLVGFALAARGPESEEERAQRLVIEADRQVHEEYRNTRRAMNIASGQAWRNLSD